MYRALEEIKDAKEMLKQPIFFLPFQLFEQQAAYFFPVNLH